MILTQHRPSVCELAVGTAAALPNARCMNISDRLFAQQSAGRGKSRGTHEFTPPAFLPLKILRPCPIAIPATKSPFSGLPHARSVQPL